MLSITHALLADMSISTGRPQQTAERVCGTAQEAAPTLCPQRCASLSWLSGWEPDERSDMAVRSDLCLRLTLKIFSSLNTTGMCFQRCCVWLIWDIMREYMMYMISCFIYALSYNTIMNFRWLSYKELWLTVWSSAVFGFATRIKPVLFILVAAHPWKNTHGITC